MFYIPVENYEKFEKKLNTIRNKGGVVNIEKGQPQVFATHENGMAWPEVEKGSPAWQQSPKHKFIPVEVEGKYEIPGWEFVATVEHTPEGNIIRKVNPDIAVPERYQTTTPECEHCHRIRDRKDTYLVRNTETGDFKQVGRSCLKDYTGGLDSQVAAGMASFINDPENFLGSLLWGAGGGSDYFWGEEFKKFLYRYIDKHGYQGSGNPGYINEITTEYEKARNNKRDLASDAEIEAVNDWALSLDLKNDYLRNAFLAWQLEDPEYKHIKLLASFINTYFKDQQKKRQQQIKQQAREKEAAGSEYVANVGDKISFTVASSKVIYEKTFSTGYHTTTTPVHRIVGTDGNIYIWATQNAVMDGDVISGTVKDHSEYQGEKQTVIYRAKSEAQTQWKKLYKEWEDLLDRLADEYDMDIRDLDGWDSQKKYFYSEYSTAATVSELEAAIDHLKSDLVTLAEKKASGELVLDEE